MWLGGLIGLASSVGAFIMFVMLIAMFALNPLNLLWYVPMFVLTVRFIWKRFQRSVTPSTPMRIIDLYPAEWLRGGSIAAEALLPQAEAEWAAECQTKRSAEAHPNEEPMTIGGHVRHHHHG